MEATLVEMKKQQELQQQTQENQQKVQENQQQMLENLTKQLETLTMGLQAMVQGSGSGSGETSNPNPGGRQNPNPNSDPGGGVHLRSVKLDFPKFDGNDPSGWLYRANQFFNYNQTLPHHKILIASFHMEGKTLIWFQEVENSGTIMS